MAAINACMAVGFSAVCALKGIQLRSLQMKLEGEIDLRGFLGIDPTVSNGYDELKQTIYMDADCTPEEMKEIHDFVMKTSPNFFNITRAVTTHSSLVAM